DMIIYVASDERYNDQAPTQFLQALLRMGKPVIVCLMKMAEGDAPAVAAHFQREVLGRLAHDAVACFTIPHLSPEQLAEPLRLAGKYRIPLLNQVSVLGEPAGQTRRRAVLGACRYLATYQEKLLAPAREDVTALEDWRSTVQIGQAEFDVRYRREY